MNMKAVIPLLAAVALGLVAAILVRNAIARNNAPVQQTNLVSVVVAKTNLDPGKELTKEDLTVSKVSADGAPSQVFNDPAQLVGRVLASPLVKGQTIIEPTLAPQGTGSGLQALVPPGMRAMTLEITETTGVGGMLMPGCHVDVISAVHDEKMKEPISRTVLQNIKVTAVGRNVSSTPPAPPADGSAPPPPPANNITVLCTPHQAQVLQLAMLSGRPWFVLRSNKDGEQISIDGATMAELRGEEAAEATDNNPQVVASNVQTSPTPTYAAPTSIKRTVQILRAGSESQVTFVVPAPRSFTAETDTGDLVPTNQ